MESGSSPPPFQALMRTLCPNFDKEDGLETVLEVPIPEEMFGPNWLALKSWGIKPSVEKLGSVFGGRDSEIQFMLGVIGAPLIPLPVRCDRTLNSDIRGHPIESSMAKYIVQQYIAAAGGDHALNSIDSMYAIGKVKMVASEIVSGEDAKSVKLKSMKQGGPGEIGGFVLWQKRLDLWSLELMVSGCKISAGSDGKVAWRQTPWQHSHASRGPPRPLRRLIQGLDPRSTANLFSNAICVGEKTVSNEDCFVLKLEADPSTLKARSGNHVEIIKHTVWGCFSQKTGLLKQIQDSHLLRIKDPKSDVFWETKMESVIQDYRTIDGVNIAHAGRTCVSLFRFRENPENQTRTRMEEVWNVEEVDFNIKGLSMDCFLPPADLKKEDEECGIISSNDYSKNRALPYKILANASRMNAPKGGTKIVAIDEDNL